MAIIRRKPAGQASAAPAVIQKSSSAAPRLRRTGITTKEPASSSFERGAAKIQAKKALLADMQKDMQEVEKLLTQLDQVEGKISTYRDRVEKAITELGLTEHIFGSMVAKNVDSYSNATTEVPVAAVYNKLPEKDFLTVVKVQMGSLRQLLSEAEIKRIAKVTPGKLTGKKFTLERVKSEAKKKGSK